MSSARIEETQIKKTWTWVYGLNLNAVNQGTNIKDQPSTVAMGKSIKRFLWHLKMPTDRSLIHPILLAPAQTSVSYCLARIQRARRLRTNCCGHIRLLSATIAKLLKPQRQWMAQREALNIPWQTRWTQSLSAWVRPVSDTSVHRHPSSCIRRFEILIFIGEDSIADQKCENWIFEFGYRIYFVTFETLGFKFGQHKQR